MAAAATTVLDGFCEEEASGLEAVFEAGALALEDDGAADFAVVVGFALILPEDLAGAGADATFFAGDLDAAGFAATFAEGFAAGFAAAATRFAGVAFAGAFDAGLAVDLAAGFAATDFAGPLADVFDALLFAGADFLAGALAEDFAGAFAAGFDADFVGAALVGFFVCFAIVRFLDTLLTLFGP